jgi:hypothetical protein
LHKEVLREAGSAPQPEKIRASKPEVREAKLAPDAAKK